MKVGAGQSAHPVVWMVLSGVAEHLRAGDHSLLELFRKRGQRSFVHTKRRRPFQVNATVTQRFSFSTEARTSAADCTFSLIADSHFASARRACETKEIRIAL